MLSAIRLGPFNLAMCQPLLCPSGKQGGYSLGFGALLGPLGRQTVYSWTDCEHDVTDEAMQFSTECQVLKWAADPVVLQRWSQEQRHPRYLDMLDMRSLRPHLRRTESETGAGAHPSAWTRFQVIPVHTEVWGLPVDVKGCHKQSPRTGLLKTTNLLSHCSKGWKSEIKVSAEWFLWRSWFFEGERLVLCLFPGFWWFPAVLGIPWLGAASPPVSASVFTAASPVSTSGSFSLLI